MSKPKAQKRVASTSSERLIFIWLFAAIIEWTLQYLNRALSPLTAADNLLYDVAIGDICATVLFIWRWPQIFASSRVRPRLIDFAVGIPTGYLMTNIAALIIGRSNFADQWIFTHPHRGLTLIAVVLIAPLEEELVYRGAFLGSLLPRTSTVWAVVITVAAATIMHDTWRVACVNQLLLCSVYLVCRRSLAASFIAHAVGNAVAFAPSLLFVFHFKGTGL
jgi:membrane protease YdiL (CAAX protease family)